jgi:hypothetical protein
MLAPPPTCTRCRRIASLDPAEVTCAHCGAALPPRIETPTSMPPICGTAQLAMKRIAELQALADRWTIGAEIRGDQLAVWIDVPTADAERGATTAETIGVIVLPAGAPFPGFLAAVDVVLADGKRTECLVPLRDFARGATARIYLTRGDTLYERAVTIN